MLHQFVTNEFKNSAVAKNQRDVRTPLKEGLPLTITCLILMAVLVVGIAKQL